MIQIKFNSLEDNELDKVIFILYCYKYTGLIQDIYFEYKYWNNFRSILEYKLITMSPEDIKDYIKQHINNISENSGFSLYENISVNEKYCDTTIFSIRMIFPEGFDNFFPLSYNQDLYDLFYKNKEQRNIEYINQISTLIEKIEEEDNNEIYKTLKKINLKNNIAKKTPIIFNEYFIEYENENLCIIYTFNPKFIN